MHTMKKLFIALAAVVLAACAKNDEAVTPAVMQKITFTAEFSFKVGIHDPCYFSKCFKEQFGVTPKLYRKQIEEQQTP